jgi:uncharacterized protein with HEPN domain
MSDRDYVVILKDILACLEKILRIVSGRSLADFSQDDLLADAVIRNLEVIGEAVKHLPTRIRRRHREIGWKKIAGLRDILIHEYFAIDYDILWDVVTREVPELRGQILAVIESEQHPPSPGISENHH